MRYRFRVVTLKEHQHAEVCPGIEVFRIKRNNLPQHGNGKLRLLFLQMLHHLLLERGDFAWNILRELRR